MHFQRTTANFKKLFLSKAKTKSLESLHRSDRNCSEFQTIRPLQPSALNSFQTTIREEPVIY